MLAIAAAEVGCVNTAVAQGVFVGAVVCDLSVPDPASLRRLKASHMLS
jgi:hypothetical protein